MAGTGTAQLRRLDDVILQVNGLVVEHPAGGAERVPAVSDVSFDVASGETLGIVGESGCGKSSTTRAIVQMPSPTSGHVLFRGHDLTRVPRRQLRRLRRQVQMIHQDPASSLNPQRNVFDIVGDPLDIWRVGSRREREEAVAEALVEVALDPDEARRRRPAQYSGGQRQRIAIARALILQPDLILCDEPVSALDVSVQAQILNLLEGLKERRRLSMVFVSHDLSVIKSVSDRVAVMYLGRLCEIGVAREIFARPRHPYTAALLAAVPLPDPDPQRARPTPLAGEPPSPHDPPSGCRFRTRCSRADDDCGRIAPTMLQVGIGHHVACHHPLDVL